MNDQSCRPTIMVNSQPNKKSRNKTHKIRDSTAFVVSQFDYELAITVLPNVYE